MMLPETALRAELAATTAAVTAAPPWVGPAVQTCISFARRASFESILLVAPFPVPCDEDQLGAALLEEVGAPGELVADLLDAFDDVQRSGLLIAFVGCMATLGDRELLAREIALVDGVVGGVIVVEEDAPDGHEEDSAREPFTLAGLVVRSDARLRSPDSGGGSHRIRRLAFCSETATRQRLPLAGVRFCVSDHQGKSLGLAKALSSAGAIPEVFADRADLVLIDHDVPFHGKLGLVEACVERGGRAFLYPHAGGATLMAEWDGIHETSPLLSGALMPAPGHVEVARRYGYPHRVWSVGWSLCPLRRRQATGRVERVLFAPSHPPHFGNSRWVEWGRRLLTELSELPIDLTVRHIGTLEENGLQEVGGVRFVAGDISGAPSMLQQIDAADVVVADYGTFASLSIARGVATVIFDSDIHESNDGTSEPRHVELYRDFVRYPFDARDGTLMDVMREAAEDEIRVSEWAALFIGDRLDTGALVRALGYA